MHISPHITSQAPTIKVAAPFCTKDEVLATQRRCHDNHCWYQNKSKIEISKSGIVNNNGYTQRHPSQPKVVRGREPGQRLTVYIII
jgi:hypothetical protein